MPITDEGYEPRDWEELRDSVLAYLEDQTADPEAGIGVGTANRAHATALSLTIAQNQETTLDRLYDAAYVQDAQGEELTKKAREFGVRRRPAVRATGVVKFERDSTASQDYVIPSGTAVSTGGVDPIRLLSTESTTIVSGDTATTATVKAANPGPDANVAAGAVDTLPNEVEGVDFVSNPNPIGDRDYTDTNGDPLIIGREREDDASLRDRTLEATSIGGASTTEAVETAIQNVDKVISATFKTNPTASATADGLDPYHGEAVVYGGELQTIAKTLRDSLSVTNLLRLEGGVHGTREATDVRVELLDQSVTVPITRPTQLSIDMTIDLVHDDTYAGTSTVRDAAVDYLGGTNTDGAREVGLGQGENVIVDELDQRLNAVRGVVATTSLTLDKDGDGTDDTTTDGDGVTILDAQSEEVLTVDESNIAVNETAR